MKFLYLLLLPLALALPSPQETEAPANGWPGTCQQCQPLPPNNKCDITTSCVYVWGHHNPRVPTPYYCACRHGYRANGYAAGDSSVQWRLPWYSDGNGSPSQEGRVFVRPGVVCDTLCDDWTLGKDGCKAVNVRPSCF